MICRSDGDHHRVAPPHLGRRGGAGKHLGAREATEKMAFDGGEHGKVHGVVGAGWGRPERRRRAPLFPQMNPDSGELSGSNLCTIQRGERVR